MAMELVKLNSETLPAIANAIRGKTGDTALLLPSEMAAAIDGIHCGDLPELATPAAESDVLSGKEYIDGSGTKKTGTLMDQIEEVETIMRPGGISLDVASTAGAAKTFEFPEPNLQPENIKSGVCIFNVDGNFVGDLPELTDPAAESDVLCGEEYIDGSGTKKTGTLVVANTVEVVDVDGEAGVGVIVQAGSTADSSTTILTLQEPNLLAENIKSGVRIFGVAGSAKANLFDDETACEMGTFQLAEDVSSNYSISLGRSDEPYMIAFWTDDPQLSDDNGNYLRYRMGGLFIKSTLRNDYSCVGIVAANGALAVSTGASSALYRVYPDSEGIYIGASSAYPLKAGITYKWIARWKS